MEQRGDQKQESTKGRCRELDKVAFNLMECMMFTTAANGHALIMRNHLTRPFPYNLPGCGWCDAIVELNAFTYLYN